MYKEIGSQSGDTNLYAYVGGNPVTYVDPDGLQKRLVFSNGTLTLFNDDGSRMGSWGATSGGRRYSPLPAGRYAVGNLRDNRTKKGMVCPGEAGYSIDLLPQMSTVGDRQELRIHPDQPPVGTQGCVGVSCNSGQAADFGNMMRGIFNNPITPDIILEVH